MPNNAATSKFADALVREVPASQLATVLKQLDADSALNANGSGCGNGCGGNCGGSVDIYGYTGLTDEDRKAVIQDGNSLREHVAARLAEVSQRFA